MYEGNLKTKTLVRILMREKIEMAWSWIEGKQRATGEKLGDRIISEYITTPICNTKKNVDKILTIFPSI